MHELQGVRKRKEEGRVFTFMCDCTSMVVKGNKTVRIHYRTGEVGGRREVLAAVTFEKHKNMLPRFFN